MVTFSLLTEVLRPLLLTLLLPQLLCGFQALWLSPPGWFCLLHLLPGMSASQALLTLGFWTIRSSETDTCHGSCEDGPSRIHVKRPWPLPSGFLGTFAGNCSAVHLLHLAPLQVLSFAFYFFTVRSLPFSSANLLFFRAHTGPTHSVLYLALWRVWLGLCTYKVTRVSHLSSTRRFTVLGSWCPTAKVCRQRHSFRDSAAVYEIQAYRQPL